MDSQLYGTDDSSMAEHRALIVDPDVRELHRLRALFLITGCAVVVTHDWYDCLEAIRAFKPDIVVMDESICWGRIDQIQECLDQNQEVVRDPFIIVKAYSKSDDDAGSDQSHLVYLEKPIPFSRMTETIRHWLERCDGAELKVC